MTSAAVIRGFSFATVMGAGASIFARNLVPFLLLTTIVTAPAYLYQTYAPPPAAYQDIWPYLAKMLFVNFVCTTLAQATLVYGTVQELRGRHASVLGCLRQGLAVILPAIGVTLAVGLAVGLTVLAPTIVMGLMGSLTAAVVTLVLMLVPGLILLTRWWVAIPVAVVERPGVFHSLARSVQLTKWSRWPILAIIVLFAIVSALETYLVELVLEPFVYRRAIAAEAAEAIGWLAGAVLTAFTSVLVGVGYFALRIDKDGADPDQVAAVFD